MKAAKTEKEQKADRKTQGLYHYLTRMTAESGSGIISRTCFISSVREMTTAVLYGMVDKEETAHFILKVTDKGAPLLSGYKRVIVTIIP